MSDPRTFNPTPEQMADMHKAGELTAKIVPMLKTYTSNAVGASLASLLATWLASYRLPGESGTNISTEGRNARVQRLVGVMTEVVRELPGAMLEIDEQAARMSRQS